MDWWYKIASAAKFSEWNPIHWILLVVMILIAIWIIRSIWRNLEDEHARREALKRRRASEESQRYAAEKAARAERLKPSPPPPEVTYVREISFKSSFKKAPYEVVEYKYEDDKIQDPSHGVVIRRFGTEEKAKAFAESLKPTVSGLTDKQRLNMAGDWGVW